MANLFVFYKGGRGAKSPPVTEYASVRCTLYSNILNYPQYTVAYKTYPTTETGVDVGNGCISDASPLLLPPLK